MILLLVVALLLPFAWLVSELSRHTWVRVILGIGTIVSTAFVTSSWVDFRENFDANHYFAEANKRLILASIHGLKGEHSAEVLDQLVRMEREYDPSYETRDQFDELVSSYSAHIYKLPSDARD